MRLLMILDHAFPPDIRVENEARSLVEAGFEVGLLAIGPDSRPRREQLHGIELFRDRLPGPIRDKFRGLVGTLPLLTWYAARRACEIHREWPFNALHVHDLYLIGAGLRAGRRLGIPVVGDLHENWVDALTHYRWSTTFPGRLFVSLRRWKRLESKWVQAVDRIVVVIEEMADRNRALGVPAEHLVVTPNTIRLQEYDAWPMDPSIAARIRSAFTVLYTGGMDRHRGLDTVIAAWPRVIQAIPDAKLVLVGDGSTRNEHKRHVEDLGLTESVQFTGRQPQESMPSWIAGADVCLVPHVRSIHTDAGIPHKLFHYMHGAKPVVVTDCRPLERIVLSEEAGLVVPSGDAKALSDALLRLFASPEEATDMGRRGRVAVAERYQWAKTVQPLIRMYRAMEAG